MRSASFRRRRRDELAAIPDDRWLAEMTRGVFRAGFNWRVIDNKWAGFEAAFHGFDPPLNAAMSEEEFDAHLKDTGIIRNAQKVASVRANGQFLVDLAREHGSAARFFADWPDSDFIGLLDVMKKRAARCHGETAMRFFRTMGKPAFMTTRDVVGRADRSRRDREAAVEPQGLPGRAGRLQRLERGHRPQPDGAEPRARHEHRTGLRARRPDGPPLRSPMPDPANIQPDAFAGTAEAYARWRPPYPAALLDWLAHEARAQPSARLLDLATGPGRIALDLAGRFGEVWAQDLEPEMIAAAQAAAERRGIGNVRWSVGPAEALEAPDNHFDLVTVGEAFHRLDQALIAEKARRWLRPGGVFATMGGGAILTGSRPWQVATVELTRRWTAKAFPTGWAQARSGVEPGLEASMRLLEGVGLQLVANRTFPQPHAWTVEAVLGYLHSTSVASRRLLGDDADAFAAALQSTLDPFADADGLLHDEVDFGCTLFRNPD